MRATVRRCLLAAMLAVASALAAIAWSQSTNYAGTRLPLDTPAGWQLLGYRSIPPHRVRFSAAGLEMRVDKSAMPVIYPLPKPLAVRAVRVRGRVEGSLAMPPSRQGEEKFDDYVFRIGLVEPGRRTLNLLQRQVAAAWVRKLFELAPKDGGISRIQFFNVGADATQIGRRRQHPLSEFIHEQVVAVPRADGTFEFEHVLDRPLEALAVWLSSDGDDTGSTFTVLVEEIALMPVLDAAMQRSRP